MERIDNVRNVDVEIPKDHGRYSRAVMRTIGATKEELDKAKEAGWFLWKSVHIRKGSVLAVKNGVIYGPITHVSELLVTERMGGLIEKDEKEPS